MGVIGWGLKPGGKEAGLGATDLRHCAIHKYEFSLMICTLHYLPEALITLQELYVEI